MSSPSGRSPTSGEATASRGWSIGKSRDEIEFNEAAYETLDELLDDIDEMMDDEGEATEAIRDAWEAWLKSEEARI
jgi:hypothetical protein